MEENVRIVLALSDLIELYPGITVTIGVVLHRLHVTCGTNTLFRQLNLTGVH